MSLSCFMRDYLSLDFKRDSVPITVLVTTHVRWKKIPFQVICNKSRNLLYLWRRKIGRSPGSCLFALIFGLSIFRSWLPSSNIHIFRCLWEVGSNWILITALRVFIPFLPTNRKCGWEVKRRDRHKQYLNTLDKDLANITMHLI